MSGVEQLADQICAQGSKWFVGIILWIFWEFVSINRYFFGVSGAALGKACEVTSLYPDLGILKGAQQGKLPILYLLKGDLVTKTEYWCILTFYARLCSQ